jgi:hypothetical protein
VQSAARLPVCSASGAPSSSSVWASDSQLSGNARIYTFNATTGALLTTFTVDGATFSFVWDLDANDTLWLLNCQNSENGQLVLFGVSPMGTAVSTTKPDLSDVEQQMLMALTVSSTGLAWIAVSNIPAVFSWSSSSMTRAATANTRLASNYYGQIVTLYNDSVLLVGHPENSCFEVINVNAGGREAAQPELKAAVM